MNGDMRRHISGACPPLLTSAATCTSMCRVPAPPPPPPHMNGDMRRYVSGACHSVRSSFWKEKGVSVRL